jgi:hypothetical protein
LLSDLKQKKPDFEVQVPRFNPSMHVTWRGLIRDEVEQEQTPSKRVESLSTTSWDAKLQNTKV